jgi:NAD(P)-dependent dehydrogenase (short-subunit alcohol dehydrogenase family)
MSSESLPLPFAGRLALVTGASRGLGAAIAQSLAAHGAHVILTGRTQGGLEATESAIHNAGGSATIAPLDITKGDAVDALAAVVAERWGKLDMLVLNAAMLGTLTPLSHQKPAEFDQVFAANTTAAWRLLRAFDGGLRASEAGRVIGITSSVARSPRAYWAAYAASKAALESLLLCYADETARITAVKVALVNPGRTRTRMRAAAFPAEDPKTLPLPEAKAAAISAVLQTDFASGDYFDLAE